MRYTSRQIIGKLREAEVALSQGRRRFRFWPIVKNLGFILKQVPFARRKAEAYPGKIIQPGQEIGAGGFMQSQAVRHLELLHQLNRS